MKAAAFGAILLNVFVLLFMMRPLRLLIVLTIHVAAIVTLANAAHRFHSDLLETAAYGWGLFGPVILVAIEHVRHEIQLDSRNDDAPPVRS